MAFKKLQFVLTQHNLIGKNGQRSMMQVAKATCRSKVDFRSFCERIGKSTSFTWQEIGAILNCATEIAKDIVAEGGIVEFGDLGTFKPSFKSKAIPVGEKFRAQDHILSPKVNFVPNRRYFSLPPCSYEQVKTKKELNAEKQSSATKPKVSTTLPSGTL